VSPKPSQQLTTQYVSAKEASPILCHKMHWNCLMGALQVGIRSYTYREDCHPFQLSKRGHCTITSNNNNSSVMLRLKKEIFEFWSEGSTHHGSPGKIFQESQCLITPIGTQGSIPMIYFISTDQVQDTNNHYNHQHLPHKETNAGSCWCFHEILGQPRVLLDAVTRKLSISVAVIQSWKLIWGYHFPSFFLVE